jgi:hypothetical protein
MGGWPRFDQLDYDNYMTEAAREHALRKTIAEAHYEFDRAVKTASAEFDASTAEQRDIRESAIRAAAAARDKALTAAREGAEFRATNAPSPSEPMMLRDPFSFGKA